MIVDSHLRIEMNELSIFQHIKLKKAVTFNDAKGIGYECYNQDGDTLILPRGVWHSIPDSIKYQDKRSFPKMPELKTTLVLDYQGNGKSFSGQQDAVDAMFEHEQGIVSRFPGSGKSALGAYFAAKCRTRTLILVHTEDILQQWKKYIDTYIPGCDLGIWRAQEKTIGHVTIATVQTLYKNTPDESWWRQFGCVIGDEIHRYGAESFESVISHSTAKYRFGLSASKTRADGMEPLVKMIVGPFIHVRELPNDKAVTVKKVNTTLSYPHKEITNRFHAQTVWQNIIDRMVEDPARNKAIASEVDAALKAGRTVLVLSRRIDHLENILALMDSKGEILAAKLRTKKEREDILTRFKSGKLKCVLATQLADEAIDIPNCDTLVLAYPTKHKDNLLQKVGRVIRQSPDKQTPLIIDFVDGNITMLKNQWSGRRDFYRKNKYTIEGETRFAGFLDKL